MSDDPTPARDDFRIVEREVRHILDFVRHEMQTLDVNDDRFLDLCDVVVVLIGDLGDWLKQTLKARREASSK